MIVDQFCSQYLQAALTERALQDRIQKAFIYCGDNIIQKTVGEIGGGTLKKKKRIAKVYTLPKK